MGETESKRGKHNRRKGANAERQVAALFNAFGFPEVRRGQVFNHEPDVMNVPFLHIEVKDHETIAIWKCLKQADDDAEKRGKYPCLWFKRNRAPWRVVLPAKLFLEMYSAWLERKANETDGTDS